MTNPHKMTKHTQTIRRLTADELFGCVWSFYGVNGLKGHLGRLALMIEQLSRKIN